MASDESRMDAMIQRLVSAWLNQQENASTLSTRQRAQFIAWVGADAERWLCDNWQTWPGRPSKAMRAGRRRE